RGGAFAPEAGLAHPAHWHVCTAAEELLPLASPPTPQSGSAAQAETWSVVHATPTLAAPSQDPAWPPLGSLWLCQSAPCGAPTHSLVPPDHHAGADAPRRQ